MSTWLGEKAFSIFIYNLNKSHSYAWKECAYILQLYIPSTGEGNGNPLQYSCLENPMDRRIWQDTVYGVARVGHDLATQLLLLKFTWEKEMATHSSILVWRIPWTEEPGGLQSTGSQRVGHNWVTHTPTHTKYKRVRHNLATKQQQTMY